MARVLGTLLKLDEKNAQLRRFTDLRVKEERLYGGLSEFLQ